MCDRPHVITFDTLVEEFKPVVGGKCASLGTMSQAGLPVPPGFAVTTSVYADAKGIATDYGELTAMLRAVPVGDMAGLATAAATAREMVRRWPIPEESAQEIREKYAELSAYCGVEDVPVAVRSSATAEDSPDASFAGEHDTYLWVRGADEVLDKVRACWASLFTDRAIAYREEMGYDHTAVDMGVAVQKMVRPRAAGVAFTLDPTNGDRSGICIDSAWGFGEGVVSGEVTPDNFLVDKVMWSINRRVISPKTHAYLLAEDAIDFVELEPEQANRPSLTDEEIVAIARLARTAEKHYGCPQDIEWAVDGDLPDGEHVVLLQARPETVWSKKPHQVSTRKDLMTSIVDTLVNPLYSRKGGASGS
ncbi:MAG TPA: PEP/pyruvate-binding domain-containing protein [Nocardioides sp.]|uniref:PEP/pyruvate-binding domain-containing protein n=1 Tax=Nocardioides sp. TaxID=35761 RepID=UPI002BF888F3|nr:PEP/pyruvate-binding domain-containing protein [Nocardioides sp.]HQR27889.1 PEP/pyruvate-binding domain-containing protein [Nocardioides sp.]